MNRSPRSKRAIQLAGLVVALVGFPGTFALAQAPAPASQAPSDSEAAPQGLRAIALEQIPDQAVTTQAELDALLPDETSRRVLERIGPELDDALVEIGSSLEHARRVLDSEPNIRTLQELGAGLGGDLERLTPWTRELDRELDKFRVALERIDGISAEWEVTATAAVSAEGGADATTQSRIEAVELEAREARSDVLERRNEILAMRDRLVDPSMGLQALLDEVQEAGSARIEGILSRDRPALWDAGVRESISSAWQAARAQPLDEVLKAGWESASARAPGLGFQFVIFAFLFLSLRSLGSRAEARAEADYNLRHAQKVFEQPAALALLLCAFLTMEVNPLVPRSGDLVPRVLFAVAALLIGRRFLVPAMLPLARGFVVLFIVDRFRDLLEAEPALERAVFLVEMLAALGFLLWLLQANRLSKIPSQLRESQFLHVLGTALQVSTAVLALAIVLDVFGWGDLSNMAGSAVLQGGYAGFAVFVLLMVAQALASFALVLWPLRLLRSISRHRVLVRRRLEWGLSAFAVAFWASLMFSHLGLTGFARDSVVGFVEASVSVGQVSLSVGDVMVFAVTVWLSLLLSRLVNFVLSEDVFTRVQAGRGVPYAIAGLVRYSLIFLGFLVGLAAAGVELSKLTVVAGGLGVGIGFGLQSVVNNFVSGLILLFERPIQVGDTVQLPDVWGEVKRIGLRASVIRTFPGAEVIVPNGNLVAEQITNWTLSDKRRRIDVSVGVQYGTPAQQVIDLLVGVAEANPNVISAPEPRAFFMNFGDSALEFELRAWIGTFDDGYSIRSALSVAVQDALEQAGIGVPFPQRDLHVVSVSPEVRLDLGAGPGAPARPVAPPEPGDEG